MRNYIRFKYLTGTVHETSGFEWPLVIFGRDEFECEYISDNLATIDAVLGHTVSNQQILDGYVELNRTTILRLMQIIAADYFRFSDTSGWLTINDPRHGHSALLFTTFSPGDEILVDESPRKSWSHGH